MRSQERAPPNRLAAGGRRPVVQAVSGVMAVTGEPDGGPLLVGFPVADFTGAMMVVQAALLGVLAREKTGEGQHIELSMLFGLIAGLTTRLATYWATGVDPPRFGGAHSVVVPYQAFQTADGYAVAGVWNGGNVRWPLFCEALGIPEVGQDPRFATNPDRVQRRDELLPILEARFRTRTTAEWAPEFNSRGVLFGAVNSIADIISHPHVVDAGVVQTVEHPVCGPVQQLAPFIGLSKTPGSINPPSPVLGADTVDVLRLAGYDEREIEALAEAGVVGVLSPVADGGVPSTTDAGA